MFRWQQIKYGMMCALQRFMMGRNGVDQLSGVLLIGGLILSLASSLAGSTVLFFMAYAMLGLSFFRGYSRNLEARRRENAWLIDRTGRIARATDMYRQMWRERGTYKYVKCPTCGQRMKVPRGRGKINIHCARCGGSFIKKI